MSKFLKSFLLNLVSKNNSTDSLPVNTTKSEIDIPLNDFELVNFLEHRLEHNIKNITYKIVDSTDLKTFYDFLNQNYYKYYQQYKFIYSYDLLHYYTKNDCIIILFYHNSNIILNENLIGCIVGKKINVQIRERFQFSTHYILETNFLSILPKYRSKNLTPYFNYILCLEAKKKWNVNTSFFTTTSSLKWINSYSEKKLYIRPINYYKLLYKNFLYYSFYRKQTEKKIYTSFSFKPSFLKLYKFIHLDSNNITDELISQIQEKLHIFSETNYSIFEIKSTSDIKNLLTNPSFYNFIFLDESNQIKMFASFYKLDICHSYEKNYTDENIFKNLYLYSYFFNITDQNSNTAFEIIFKYLHDNKIADIVSIYDIFGYTEKNFYCMKLIDNSKKLLYYSLNLELGLIRPQHNSLITI